MLLMLVLLVLLRRDPVSIDKDEVRRDQVIDADGPVVSVAIANHDYKAVEPHDFNFIAFGKPDRQIAVLAMAHTDTYPGEKSGKAVGM